MQRTTLSTVALLVVLAAAILTGLAPVVAQSGETPPCGVTVLVDGAPFWVALPCGALTPWATATSAATATPNRTPTVAPSATSTATPFPTPTPEAACRFRPEGSYNVNIRSGPGTTYDIVGSLRSGAEKSALGWTRNGLGEMWVQFAEGYSARSVLTLTNRDECADEMLLSGQ